MNRIYVVKKGDTLTGIAAREKVDRYELASLNDIHNHNLIKIDQVLILPRPAIEVTPEEIGPLPLPQLDDLSIITCQFIDASNEPIEGMHVNLTIGAHKLHHSTDSDGFVPAVVLEPSDEIKISVKTLAGEWKTISEVKPAGPTTHARVVSPKIKRTSEQKLHEGPAQPAKPVETTRQEIGSTTFTRSQNGHPVQQVALECPNPENLRLEANHKYREIILGASRRSKLSPHAIAAIMNAEAARILNVKKLPVIDKKAGKQKTDAHGTPVFIKQTYDTGEWDPRSENPRSSARGMTQFLDATWISLALTKGTFLYERAKREGWITEKTKTVQRGKDKVEKTYPQFNLADGTVITSAPKSSLDRLLSSRRFIRKWATSSDKNIQNLLDLRYDPECAINTAVDYGLQNLEMLKSKGVKVDSIPDGEKAKVIYLTHHLGADDAISFIYNTMSAKKAELLLRTQIKDEGAEIRAKRAGGDYLKAHRNWLGEFIDNKIIISDKMCTRQGTLPRHLIDLTIAIR